MTIASVFLTAVAVDQLVLPWIVSMTPTVSVPNVIGKKSNEGQQLLTSSGLRIAEVREQYSDNTPAGIIMSQLPYEGAIVKEGRRAYITVSKGIEHIQVPNIIGMSIRDARMALMRSGLVLGTQTSRPDESTPAGNIISINYTPGTKVQRETLIDVVVSLGSGTPIPDVVGLPLSDAEEALRSLGFAIGPIVRRKSDKSESGTVLTQTPNADVSVPSGTLITLVIAE